MVGPASPFNLMEHIMTVSQKERDHRIATYLRQHREQLELLEQMWSDPRVQCYDDNEMPSSEELRDGSVFLVGPTSRNQILEYNWRCQAVAHLREAEFKGFIYVPEPRGQEEKSDFISDLNYIHRWGSDRLFGHNARGNLIVAWIPRDAHELLGLNTQLEFGIALAKICDKRRHSLFLGYPPGAQRMGLLRHYADLAGQKTYYSLESLCYAVMDKEPPARDEDLDYDIPF